MASAKSPRSRTGKAKQSGKVDARVQRTRDALGNALIDLLREQAFDSIRLQDVLARAGVGRSTFYEHFKDKDDLFHSDSDEFFGRISAALADRNDPSDRVFPLKEFLGHVREMETVLDAIAAAGKSEDNFILAQEHFARGIERRLSQIPRAASIPSSERPALAHSQAGALMSLIRFWRRRGMKEGNQEIDDLFHRLFWNGAARSSP